MITRCYWVRAQDVYEKLKAIESRLAALEFGALDDSTCPQPCSVTMRHLVELTNTLKDGAIYVYCLSRAKQINVETVNYILKIPCPLDTLREYSLRKVVYDAGMYVIVVENDRNLGNTRSRTVARLRVEE